jgi:sugar lactone lactonase YvrE
VERRRVHEDEDVRLLVLVEPVDERSAEFCPEVAEAVAELFARESLSVTGGLLRALRQAHANLAEWNRRSLREHQVAVGVTCVAIRDGEATIAQVGPGLAYIDGPEGQRRLAPDGEAASPIGGAEPVEPAFFSTPVIGRVLLLLTSTVESTAGSAAINHALSLGPERALADLFVRTRNLRDMTAVLVAEVDAADEDTDEDIVPPAEVIASDADFAPIAVDRGEREPLHDLEPEPETAPVEVARADAAAAEPAPVEAEPEPAPVEAAPVEPAAAEGARVEAAPAAQPTEWREPWPPPSTPSTASPARQRPSSPRTPAPSPAREAASAPPVVIDSGQRRTTERTTPSRPRRSLPAVRKQPVRFQATSLPGSLGRVAWRRTTAGSSVSRWRAPLLIGVAVLAVVLLAVCTIPSLMEEDRGAQLEDALTSAQAHISAATEATDAAGSRTELEAALADISRARSMAPEDPRVSALQSQVEQGLAELDAVVDIPDAVDLEDSGLRRVFTFDGAVTAPFAPAGLVSGGGALWVTDTQRGRVFRIDPADPEAAPVEIYAADATYGDVTAREPRAITWDEAGNRLLVLDNALTLFSIAPAPDAVPAPIPLRGVEDLKSAEAIAAYDGNLYVLDPSEGEVWRYLTGGGGFDSERGNTLGGVDIGDARALAIDGDIYLLGASGVRHFRAEEELGPLLNGIDRELSSPAGIVVDRDQELVYIADRGNRRIVVSTREGVYQRQYRNPQFFDLRGIALSPDGATVYALTGEGIFAFTPTS